MRVVWTLAATRSVRHAYDYLHEFNPSAAMALAQALFAAGDHLVHFPQRGRAVSGTALRELLTMPPYVIRYRIDGDTVVILRVRHAAQRPTNP